jgi:hypothetical protein
MVRSLMVIFGAKLRGRLELTTVPVVLADELSGAQITAFRLLANRSANWAEWDDELLKLESEELQASDFPLELTGFDADDLNRLLDSDAGTSRKTTRCRSRRLNPSRARAISGSAVSTGFCVAMRE